jgi:hypothetical protein
VFQLAALFSLDSVRRRVPDPVAAGAVAVPPLRPVADLGGRFFFVDGLLSSASQVSAWLARRIGLINTMVFTHIPANLCMVAAAFAPSLPVALAC